MPVWAPYVLPLIGMALQAVATYIALDKRLTKLETIFESAVSDRLKEHSERLTAHEERLREHGEKLAGL